MGRGELDAKMEIMQAQRRLHDLHFRFIPHLCLRARVEGLKIDTCERSAPECIYFRVLFQGFFQSVKIYPGGQVQA